MASAIRASSAHARSRRSCRVSPWTITWRRPRRTQAPAALLFLYRDVLRLPVAVSEHAVRAKRRPRGPVVLTRAEAWTVLDGLTGVPWLVALLLTGSGLRLAEALALRVKDIDLDRREVIVRSGKGGKDRRTMLADVLRARRTAHLERVRTLHRSDVARGDGRAPLPYALGRKHPHAAQQWAWQWLFPARRTYRDPTTGARVRHHRHETVIQRAVAAAVRASRLSKRASCHTFRHSFATHLLEDGYEIRTRQEL
jgi:integrase